MEQWSIKKSNSDELYKIEKVNTATWEGLLKKIKKYDWTGIYDWVSIPHSNKLAIYIRKENFCRLCIWNLETWTCEKIIKAMFPHNLFRRSDGFYILESGIDNATIKMRNLKTLKYNFRLYINKPHYITMSAKAYEKEILIQRYDYNKL